MNKFESNEKDPFAEYADLIQYYEDLNEEERLKEKEECGPHIEELEELIAPWLGAEIIDPLYAIETAEEALDSEERDVAKKALGPKNSGFGARRH